MEGATIQGGDGTGECERALSTNIRALAKGSILFAGTRNAMWGWVCRWVAVFGDGDPYVDEVNPDCRCRGVVGSNMRMCGQCCSGRFEVLGVGVEDHVQLLVGVRCRTSPTERSNVLVGAGAGAGVGVLPECRACCDMCISSQEPLPALEVVMKLLEAHLGAERRRLFCSAGRGGYRQDDRVALRSDM